MQTTHYNVSTTLHSIFNKKTKKKEAEEKERNSILQYKGRNINSIN